MKNILGDTPHAPLNGRLRFVTEFVRKQDLENRRVLDVGCGFGWFLLHALSQGASQVTGIESRELDLATARRYLDSDRLSLEVGNAIDIPFPQGSFDTVAAWEVLEHIPKHTERQMFAEIARVLRPGGTFFLSTPFAALRSKLLDPAWWLIGHRHYDLQDLLRYAMEARFSVEACTIRGRWWELAELLNLYTSKWVLRRGPLFQGRLHHLDRDWLRADGFMNVFMRLTRYA